VSLPRLREPRVRLPNFVPARSESAMRRTVFTLASTLFLASGVLAADGANLGPTFVKGSTAKYELNNRANQLIQSPQGEMNIDVESTLIISCEVTAVTEDGATVRATIEGIKSSLQSPMLADSFDSSASIEQDASSQIAQFVRPIIGQSFTVQFDATGSNADVAGVEQFIPQGPQGQLVAQAIGAQGLGTAVVGFYVLKDGLDLVDAGSEWSDKQDAPAPPLGVISIVTNSKLDSIDSGMAKVIVNGKATFVPDPAASQQGMSMAIDESSIDGEIKWNTDTDMLQQLTSNSIIVLSMSMAAMPEAKQTMRIVNTSSAKRLD
jgi:hypothetical protein